MALKIKNQAILYTTSFVIFNFLLKVLQIENIANFPTKIKYVKRYCEVNGFTFHFK